MLLDRNTNGVNRQCPAAPGRLAEIRQTGAPFRALALSLPDLRVLASVPVGREPYHIAATASGILFVANHASNTVTIMDGSRRVRLGTLRLPPGPHGLAVLTHRPDQR